jgi:hypothetical protein
MMKLTSVVECYVRMSELDLGQVESNAFLLSEQFNAHLETVEPTALRGSTVVMCWPAGCEGGALRRAVLEMFLHAMENVGWLCEPTSRMAVTVEGEEIRVALRAKRFVI